MNIFASLASYGGKWSVKSERAFTPEEQRLVKKAVVVDSNYGTSACFFMTDGSCRYIPMSNDAKSGTGEEINISEATLLTLEKPGEEDIIRVRG